MSAERDYLRGRLNSERDGLLDVQTQLASALKVERGALQQTRADCDHQAGVTGRGLHSPTSQLNLSRFGRRAILCPICDEL